VFPLGVPGGEGAECSGTPTYIYILTYTEALTLKQGTDNYTLTPQGEHLHRYYTE
jgi:hypothetical protein